MKANIALKPCPFCGFDKPFIHAVEYDPCINIISCSNCHIEITMPTFIAGKKSNNKERVILGWNRRADDGTIKMADFINRNLALEAIKNLSRNVDFDNEAEERGWNNAIDLAYAAVVGIPIADVRPERHGEWIEEEGFVICSECGEDHAWEDYRASYCEDCGAKMDGKDGESDCE